MLMGKYQEFRYRHAKFEMPIRHQRRDVKWPVIYKNLEFRKWARLEIYIQKTLTHR